MSEHPSCHVKLFDIYCSEEKKGQMYQICISASWHFFSYYTFPNCTIESNTMKRVRGEGEEEKRGWAGGRDRGGKSFLNSFLTSPAHHDTGVINTFWAVPNGCICVAEVWVPGPAAWWERKEDCAWLPDLFSMTCGHTSWDRPSGPCSSFLHGFLHTRVPVSEKVVMMFTEVSLPMVWRICTLKVKTGYTEYLTWGILRVLMLKRGQYLWVELQYSKSNNIEILCADWNRLSSNTPFYTYCDPEP